MLRSPLAFVLRPALVLHLAFVLVLAAASASAQTPDPTAASRYFPLGVGDEWQYEQVAYVSAPPQAIRRVVTGDSTVGGVRYAVRVDSRSSGPGMPLVFHARELLRLDPATGRVVVLAGGGESAQTCPLGAAFGALLDCTPMPGTNGGPDETRVVGALGGTVDVGGTPVAVEAAKGFVEGFGDGGVEGYAAPLGYLGTTGAFCEGCSLQLRFARVGGVEYGRRVVASGEWPAGGRVTVAASPNPTSGRVTVRVSLAEPAAVAVTVFDALGRRVAVLHDGALPSGEQAFTLDTAALPAGVYVVRLAGAAASARFSVVR